MYDLDSLHKGQKSLSAPLRDVQSPSPLSFSLICVLNADMKFPPHLPTKPKGIGQQDTVSLLQQKNR